ncbi:MULTISPECIES: CHAT domain-containing protein [Spirulina sp. CCY15215]|uniref:CHAT domain-containing protein n=1 Tax=Spirulina sp. CCY15215 TaxID=2767591 RepID=UPI0019521C76|nr:CHAT domain-containing protein [Spirulina major]
MNKFGNIVLAFYYAGLGMAIAPYPSLAQSGNQSDITGPNPVEIVPNLDTNNRELESNFLKADRLAYEAQLQQASNSEAVQLLEEYQALDFCNHLKLERCGKVPTAEQIVQVLNQNWQQTGQKSAVIYVSSQQEQIEILSIFPSISNSTKQSLSPEKIASSIHRVQVPEASKPLVQETVKNLRRNITNIRRVSPVYLESAQQLYQWVIAPLEEELRNREIDTLVFSMDSGLRLIPISVLHDGEQFLMEKYNISVIPSFGLTDTGYFDVRKRKLLAMGATQFRDQNPLPAVELELEAIAQTSWQSEIFFNAEFTVENFIKENRLGQFGIIHLATHGEFKPGEIENSYIQFTDRRLNLFELRQLAKSLGWTDGDRPLIELFVLSACQTAVGDESAELGFAGLAIQVGVKSALASVWRVSDLGTLALMGEYYQQLAQTPIKVQALRQAQLKLLKGETRISEGKLQFSNGSRIPLPPALQGQTDANLSHPFFWSSFIAIGNWN